MTERSRDIHILSGDFKTDRDCDRLPTPISMTPDTRYLGGTVAATGKGDEYGLLDALKSFLYLDPIVRNARRKEFARKHNLTVALLDQLIKDADRIKSEAARGDKSKNVDTAIDRLNVKHAFVMAFSGIDTLTSAR